MNWLLSAAIDYAPALLGVAAGPLGFVANATVKRLFPFIMAAIAGAFVAWLVHGWTVTAWVRADLAAEREAHDATRADLATERANVQTLQAAVQRQNQQIAAMAAEAERITSARTSAATQALQRARQPRREAIKGVEAWNATVAD